MSKRKSIPPEIESHVLLASARRCALCYGLDGNLERRKGQIAHIDQDSSNSLESNLVFLCLEHHDEYDSSTSQVKGVTEHELQEYKNRLVDVIATGGHMQASDSRKPEEIKAAAMRGHDEKIFAQSNGLLGERFLLDFLADLRSDDSYYLSSVRKIDQYRAFFSESGSQYIDENIAGQLGKLLEAIDELLLFLARHFFVYPQDQGNSGDLRLCLYPELNVDRAGSGEREEELRYNRRARELDELADRLKSIYGDYRISIKRKLYL